MARVDVVGFKELEYKLRRFSDEAPVATAFGMYEGMQQIMVDAKDRAPKDTTMMARSGYVTPPDLRAGSIRIDSGFGGGSAEYVVRQHEVDMPHPRGGEFQFFSKAIDAGRGYLLATIKRHLAAFIKTGWAKHVEKIVPASPTEDVPFVANTTGDEA